MRKATQTTEQSEQGYNKASRRILAAFCMVSLLMAPTVMNQIVKNSSVATVLAASTASVTITESSGWLESAYVEWSPVTNATKYNVYYKAASAADSQYTQIDASLVRDYSSSYPPLPVLLGD